MSVDTGKTIVVIGATGRQGGAVTRALVNDGWHVRALTRDANSSKAQALSALGAEVVQADMDNRRSIDMAFAGAYGVYSVQNPMPGGLEAEIRQGKLVADVAKNANIQHLVYSSAAVDYPTGVGLWDSKLQIENYLKALGVPATILRPTAFMELMTDKDYYPPVSTWYLMPKLMGANRPIGWIATDDLGVIAAKAFASSQQFVGQEIKLASDVKSIEECRAIYKNVTGKSLSSVPMPVWLFKRFVGSDLITMWQWLRTGNIDFDTQSTHTIHPTAMTVDTWLHKQYSMV
jgi:uncharacterized protein YbjT (DUF2867 family)